MSMFRKATRFFRKGAKISFYVEAWKNAELTRACVGYARVAYPEARIALFSDGDPDPAYRTIGEEHSAEVIYGERLWVMEKAGPLWKRRFKHFMCDQTEYLFKIDTDTGIYRPFLMLPKDDAIFGTIWAHEPIPFITGGFIGMPRSIAARILSSGLLDDDFLKDYNNPDATPPMNTEDRALGAIAQRLGIKLLDHPEVRSLWKQRTPNPSGDFAVIHPCKDGRL